MTEEPFIPTVENPGRVSFSEDGKTWTVTRDIFLLSEEGTIQMYVTETGRAGGVLEPAVQYVDDELIRLG